MLRVWEDDQLIHYLPYPFLLVSLFCYILSLMCFHLSASLFLAAAGSSQAHDYGSSSQQIREVHTQHTDDTGNHQSWACFNQVTYWTGLRLACALSDMAVSNLHAWFQNVHSDCYYNNHTYQNIQ